MESKYDYVVFDIETTGLHPDSDQICEIAAIGVKDGLPQGLFSTLVAIEGSMPEAARHPQLARLLGGGRDRGWH